MNTQANETGTFLWFFRPTAVSAQRAGVARGKKVALEPGYSALDWARLKTSGQNLRGVDAPGPLRVSHEELSRHNTREDAWTALQGRVYNITPYLKFHPGGVDEIMKCAGKDGTKLFRYYHPWVNFENMLDTCLVGFYTP
ncbi:hypothetical protein TRICI_004155 [Trichomonascus ciferrii]|uniref:Cytochrome b5 heme-binding domain-containing protein n=1 Tax=Trichomonascus ciferrii TaxID=44093 RepID=A0A642V1P4_9ASCO|nr:hypothetical protein TRICI_004155 [Trichomonascus ciferrii]